MRGKVPPLKTEEGFCCLSNKPRNELLNISPKSTSFNHHLRPAYILLDQRMSKNVAYLFTCKTYTESTEEFRSKFNNYRCLHRNFLRKKNIKQESFTLILLKVFTKEKVNGKAESILLVTKIGHILAKWIK